MLIEDRVRKIVLEHADISESEEIDDNASFQDDLGLDSLRAVELIMSLEEEFDFEIPDEDAEEITNMKIAIEYVKNNVQQ